MDSYATLQPAQIVFDSTNARASAEFWRSLLPDLKYRDGQEPPPPGEDDPAGRDWLNLLQPDGERCLAFQQVDELPRSTWPDSTVPQQLHLDLTVESIEELEAVKARVEELGGTVKLYDVDEHEAIYVFGDLDGHPFCVFTK